MWTLIPCRFTPPPTPRRRDRGGRRWSYTRGLPLPPPPLRLGRGWGGAVQQPLTYGWDRSVRASGAWRVGGGCLDGSMTARVSRLIFWAPRDTCSIAICRQGGVSGRVVGSRGGSRAGDRTLHPSSCAEGVVSPSNGFLERCHHGGHRRERERVSGRRCVMSMSNAGQA